MAFEICLENWKCSTFNSFHSNCLTCNQKFPQRFIYVPIEFYLLCYENNSILMDIVCNKTYSFKISATVQNTASKGDKFYLVLQETVGDGISQLYFCGHLIKWNCFLWNFLLLTYSTISKSMPWNTKCTVLIIKPKSKNFDIQKRYILIFK